MLLRKSQDQINLMNSIKNKQKQSLIEKHQKAQQGKMQRIINTYHKSGIQGVDDALNKGTQYYSNDHSKLNLLMQQKNLQASQRKVNMCKMGGTS